MLTCKITLPDSPHPVIISKNPRLRAFYLARQIEFRFLYNKYQKKFFSFSAAVFCRKYLAFARKILVLPEPGGAQPSQPPGSYTYGCKTTCLSERILSVSVMVAFLVKLAWKLLFLVMLQFC